MALKFTILTRANMRQCRAGETLQEHGILFERLENGDGRFRINLRIDRLRVHRVVGLESEGVTREKVEELVEKYRTEAREDRLNLPKGRKTVLSFERGCWSLYREAGGGRREQSARQSPPAHPVPDSVFWIDWAGAHHDLRPGAVQEDAEGAGRKTSHHQPGVGGDLTPL